MYTTVMPAHESVPYIGAAIESVLTQSLPCERTLIIFNGLGRDFSEAMKHVSPYRSAVEVHIIEESGQSAAIAWGIKLSTSKYIAFLDTDDLWLPDKQQSQIRTLSENPQFDAVAGAVTNFKLNDDGDPVLGKSAKARVFGATTFRDTAFEKYGSPSVEDSQFEWLYRWWTEATAQGIHWSFLEQEVLRRRIHSNNSWVLNSTKGSATLMKELRRLSGIARSTQT